MSGGAIIPRLVGSLSIGAAIALAAPASSAQTSFGCSKPDAIALARKLVRDHFQVSTAGGPFKLGNSWAEPTRRQELALSWGVQQSSTSVSVSSTFGSGNIAHLAFLGPYDYWLDWNKTGAGARLHWCNYIIKSVKDKARYMAEPSYVFVSEEWKDAPAGKAQHRMTLSTRGRTTLGGVDVLDALRVTMLIVSPYSVAGSGSSTVTISKKNPRQGLP